MSDSIVYEPPVKHSCPIPHHLRNKYCLGTIWLCDCGRYWKLTSGYGRGYIEKVVWQRCIWRNAPLIQRYYHHRDNFQRNRSLIRRKGDPN